MEDLLQAALAFYAWLFDREFSSDEAAEFSDLVGKAEESGDQLSLDVVRHAAQRWGAIQGGQVADRNAQLAEAVTLLRELGLPLCEWLVARYDEANRPLPQGYCLKCRTKREIKDHVSLTLKNARPATQGTCPVCGTKITRIGKAYHEAEALAANGGGEPDEPEEVPETPPAEPDPPRTAYALIEAPDAAAVGQQFEAEIGLSPDPVPGVRFGRLIRPPSSVGPYNLEVQVVADGFEIGDGESWRHNLRVTARRPYPKFTLHMTPAGPVDNDSAVFAGTIHALYSVDGQTIGMAVRPIAVVRDASRLVDAPPPEEAAGANLTIPVGEVPADLTIRISRGDSAAGGRLLWSFGTPHASVTRPDRPLESDIGKQPSDFARRLIDDVGVAEGKPTMYPLLRGKGLTISDHMPREIWPIFAQVSEIAKAEDRIPTVFILSAEAYVPWELAVLENEYLVDKDAPPFFGAQAMIGRWVLGNTRPKLPPPVNVDIESMAVIFGQYNLPGWKELKEALAEADQLQEDYSAQPVDANTNDVLECLDGDPQAQLLHFAVHGVWDSDSVQNGLVLVDGLTLQPDVVKGKDLSKAAPFVFLNACQVGSSYEVLGDYSGMAEAFLFSYASGAIAPLWSVKDTIAREIALEFYKEAFAGTPPAELLRRERAKFTEDSLSTTCLSYLLYGHPTLKLTRKV